jgi:hypothetical protein
MLLRVFDDLFGHHFALEAAERHFERLVFLDTNGCHAILNIQCGG